MKKPKNFMAAERPRIVATQSVATRNLELGRQRALATIVKSLAGSDL
jgi:hypothetical protein